MRYVAAVFLGCVIGGVPAAEAGQKVDFDARYTKLHAVEQVAIRFPESKRDALISDQYRWLFHRFMEPRTLKKLSSDDLRFLFKAASMAAFYTVDKIYANDLRHVAAELEMRNAATNEQRVKLFHVLVQLRDFVEAKALLEKHPELEVEALPRIPPDFGSAQTVAFDATDGADELKSLAFDVSKGVHLVVISHPLCSFSRNAVAALEADPEVASVFSQRTIWLAPVDGRLHLKENREWNIQHPQAHIVQARHESDWPMLNEWATPQFYAIRDGAVIAHVTGWPKEGRKVELAELLKRLSTAD